MSLFRTVSAVLALLIPVLGTAEPDDSTAAAGPLVEIRFALYHDGELIGAPSLVTRTGRTTAVEVGRGAGRADRYRIQARVESVESLDGARGVNVAMEVLGRDGGDWLTVVKRRVTMAATEATPESADDQALPGPERAPDAGFSLQAQAFVWDDPEEAKARCRAATVCEP